MKRTFCTFCTLCILASPLSGIARVSISVHGDTLACSVPHDPTNRWLDMGVAEHYVATIQLFGDASDLVTFQRTLPPITCEDDEEALVGFCLLRYAPNGHALAQANVRPCETRF